MSRRRRHLLRLALAGALGVTATTADADRVVRRGLVEPLHGQIRAIDDGGVQFETDLGAVRVIPWDRVRSIETTRQFANLDDHLAAAETLWRARSRLERRDVRLAEPLFERLFERYRGRTHETALVVAEGLLRCRLERRAWPQAVIPALEAARLRRAGVETDSYTMLPPVIDVEAALCTELPPIWSADARLQRLDQDLAAYDPQGDAVVDAVRAWFICSLDPERPLPDASPAEAAPLTMLVRAMRNEPQARVEVRRLEEMLPTLDGWRAAWARFAIGAALSAREDFAVAQRGLVHLAHLPARSSSAPARLVEAALEQMIRVLESRGDDAGAAALRRDLQRLTPAAEGPRA